MSSSCIEEVSVPNDDWYRITAELLGRAGIEINGPAPSDLRIKNPLFFKRVLQEGSLGLGESYMDGWWDCERLDIFFHKVLRAGLENQLPRHLKDTLRIAAARLFNLQSKKRSWIVGKEHYDLGNDLFSQMLDPYMQYSCAYWKEAQSLEEAQQAKLDLIAVSCSWSRGCGCWILAAAGAVWPITWQKIITLAWLALPFLPNSKKMAQQRCEGLDVTILLQDYRDLHDSFDRIVSVGMFEHVGPKNYATYFDVVNRNMKADGLFLLHTIGSNKTDLSVDPWINKYIFPNGCLPSVRHIAKASETHFVMEDWHNIGADYDTTLMAWYERFLASWPDIADNYTERFKRMFSYYLNACAGAFRARDIQLWQVVFSRGAESGLRVAR
ncbi:Cyclopropane-fatty-acyl-phospholipid synthase [Raoultella terrigena]|nr:Cyclopropane-fatty-acyl-phospholipid synthase [Raoultella terrigena]